MSDEIPHPGLVALLGFLSLTQSVEAQPAPGSFTVGVLGGIREASRDLP